MIHSLFGDADGMVAVKEMEAILGELPGLEGSRFLTDALRGSGDPARPTARDGLSDQSRGRTLRPLGRVHDLEVHRLELVPELVRARVVLRRSSGVAFGHQLPDLLRGLPRRSRLPFEIESEDAIPARQEPPLLAGRDVGRVIEVVHDTDGGRHVEVVRDGLAEP